MPDTATGYITLERDFVASLLALGAAATRLMEIKPTLVTALEAVAPEDADVDHLIECAIADFGN